MKITIEIEDQRDSDAAATCAWLDMTLRDEGHAVGRVTWTPSAIFEQALVAVLDAELDEHGYEDDDEKRGQVARHFAACVLESYRHEQE